MRQTGLTRRRLCWCERRPCPVRPAVRRSAALRHILYVVGERFAEAGRSTGAPSWRSIPTICRSMSACLLAVARIVDSRPATRMLLVSGCVSQLMAAANPRAADFFGVEAGRSNGQRSHCCVSSRTMESVEPGQSGSMTTTRAGIGERSCLPRE